jgi:hypothetical protein
MSRSFKLRPSTAHESFGDETVILNLDSGCYYSAQGTASVIWGLVSDGISEAAIVKSIEAEYSGDSDEILRATTTFLDQLVEEALVAPEPVVDGEGAQAPMGAGKLEAVFSTPSLQKYTDMEEMLLLDPIHEVDERGWPSARKPPEQ